MHNKGPYIFYKLGCLLTNHFAMLFSCDVNVIWLILNFLKLFFGIYGVDIPITSLVVTGRQFFVLDVFNERDGDMLFSCNMTKEDLQKIFK